MGLLDFNPHDPAVIQRQLRERQDELCDRAATAIEDLRQQVLVLERHRDDIRRQVEPWGLAMHRLVYVVGIYLQRHRVSVVPAYRDAITFLLDRAEKAVATALASPDSLLPPEPPRPKSVGQVVPNEWKLARKRRGTPR